MRVAASQASETSLLRFEVERQRHTACSHAAKDFGSEMSRLNHALLNDGGERGAAQPPPRVDDMDADMAALMRRGKGVRSTGNMLPRAPSRGVHGGGGPPRW